MSTTYYWFELPGVSLGYEPTYFLIRESTPLIGKTERFIVAWIRGKREHFYHYAVFEGGILMHDGCCPYLDMAKAICLAQLRICNSQVEDYT